MYKGIGWEGTTSGIMNADQTKQTGRCMARAEGNQIRKCAEEGREEW